MPMPIRRPYDDRELESALQVYADAPMAEGDAVLFLDGKVVVELEHLAFEWDDAHRRSTSEIVRAHTHRLAVGIARRDLELLPSDYQIWRDLHADLRHDDIELLPLRCIPAA